VHGADPNWGRIVAAAGRSGGRFEIERTSVRVGDVLLFEHGLPHDDAAPEAGRHLEGTDIRIEIDLGTGGSGTSTIWTCDLTAEYVRINGEYRT
jgi:glutamate N-acetyltransferase/amino-acid N-acetyltransferase